MFYLCVSLTRLTLFISSCTCIRTNSALKCEKEKKKKKLLSKTIKSHTNSIRILLRVFCVEWMKVVVWYWLEMYTYPVCVKVFSVLSHINRLVYNERTDWHTTNNQIFTLNNFFNTHTLVYKKVVQKFHCVYITSHLVCKEIQNW